MSSRSKVCRTQAKDADFGPNMHRQLSVDLCLGDSCASYCEEASPRTYLGAGVSPMCPPARKPMFEASFVHARLFAMCKAVPAARPRKC